MGVVTWASGSECAPLKEENKTAAEEEAKDRVRATRASLSYVTSIYASVWMEEATRLKTPGKAIQGGDF